VSRVDLACPQILILPTLQSLTLRIAVLSKLLRIMSVNLKKNSLTEGQMILTSPPHRLTIVRKKLILLVFPWVLLPLFLPFSQLRFSSQLEFSIQHPTWLLPLKKSLSFSLSEGSYKNHKHAHQCLAKEPHGKRTPFPPLYFPPLIKQHLEAFRSLPDTMASIVVNDLCSYHCRASKMQIDQDLAVGLPILLIGPDFSHETVF
jgi:hypothetical protein